MKRASNQERGATLIEYALLVALVAMTAMAALREVGTQTACVLARAAVEVQGGGAIPYIDVGDGYTNCS